MQISSDLFNLITGPFSVVPLTEQSFDDGLPLVYQPQFWDFLQADRQSLSASKGHQSHFLNRIQVLECLTEVRSIAPGLNWQTVDNRAFKEQFDWSQQKFLQKRLQKTVPIVCQRSSSRLIPENLAWLLKHLLSDELPGWSYGFWEDGQGYLGHSPELISDWKGKQNILKTSAVAGTLKNSAKNETEILQDSKIRDEHQFVVEDIYVQLKKTIEVGQIRKQETNVQKLKHLLHLKTDFECHDVNFNQALDLLYKLHPTAALGVYPRELEEMKSFSKIKLQEERSTFAAPFAFMSSDHILCIAAIRNLFFSNSGVQIFSGCGVTTNSEYESELSELQLKRDSVKKMMGIFQ